MKLVTGTAVNYTAPYWMEPVKCEFKSLHIWHQKKHNIYNIKGKLKKMVKAHFSFSHSCQRNINLKIKRSLEDKLEMEFTLKLCL